MAVICLCALFAVATPARPQGVQEIKHSSPPTFTTLIDFDGANGANPEFISLVQGTDGNLYGTTADGGANDVPACAFSEFVGCGTVFKITPGGTLTTVHNFDYTDGYDPSGLVLATDGNFYGTTSANAGGVLYSHGGTVFKMTPGGTLTTLYSFCAQPGCTDGRVPAGMLVQATDGDFYGVTEVGGASDNYCPRNAPPGGCGTVFKITPGGTLTTLYSFCAQTGCADGGYPQAGLVQATDGNFYGVTANGGANDIPGCIVYLYAGCGTVFKITPGGTLTTLHNFGYTDGAYPLAGLVQATDGNFYGATFTGGANGAGTVFKITAWGKLTTLHSFEGTDGASPFGGLVQATDGNFYGTTFGGGAANNGTVFKITPGGTLTTLYSFCPQAGCWDGAQVPNGLVQATDGRFYGGAVWGGVVNDGTSDGTLFRLSVGLGPFVKTDPTSGMVGAAVIILGNNLTGATGVSFNGAAARFTVVSSSEIETTVPPGATTGMVQVTTPSGTLKSNVAFRVTAPCVTARCMQPMTE